MSMKRFAFAALTAMAAMSPAFAADMPIAAPTFKAPPLPVPLAGSGLFVGGDFGVGVSGKEFDFVTLPGIPVASVPGTGALFPAGIMAGGVIGWGGNLGSFYSSLEIEGNYDFTRSETSCALGRCGSKNGAYVAVETFLGVPFSNIGGAQTQLAKALPSQLPLNIQLPSTLSGVQGWMVGPVAGLAGRSVTAYVVGDGQASEFLWGPMVGARVQTAVAKGWDASLQYDYAWFNKGFVPVNATAFFPTGANFKELDEQRLMTRVTYHF